MTTPAENRRYQQHRGGGGYNHKQSRYRHGDPAWVKLDRWPWWPAKVIPPAECPLVAETSRPVLACVHFPIENSEVIYEKSKIQPWKDQTNPGLIRRTSGKIKQDGSMLALFHKVLKVLSTECGVTVPNTKPSLKSKSCCQRQFPAASSPKVRLKEADTLGHHSSVLSQMEMGPTTPSLSAKCKAKLRTPPAGVFEPSALTLQNGSSSEPCLPLAGRTGQFGTATRKLDKAPKEEPAVKCLRAVERQRSASMAGELHKLGGTTAKSTESRISRKRCHSINSRLRNKKSQRCLENVFSPQVKTLQWDPNIQEDSCDVTDDGSPLTPMPLSQPEPGTPDAEDDSLEGDDDSGDDDLPDVLSSTSKDPIRKGTLLWVKHQKFPFWPTIVRNCYRKRKTLKKITVMFIGKAICDVTRGRPFTLRYNRKTMVPFGSADSTRHSMFMEEGRQWQGSECSFSDTIARVEDFLMKQCLGVAPCPFTFFADDIQATDVIGTETCPLEDGEQGKDDSTSHLLHGEEEQASDTVEEDKNDSQDNNDSQDDEKEEDGEGKEELSQKMRQVTEKRWNRGDGLLSKIKTERMKDYLMDIYTGKRESRRHTEFKTHENNKSLNAMAESGFGPIDDDEQQLELAQVLAKYFKEASGKNIPNMAYIFKVWLPEAIIEALNMTAKKGWASAEVRYLRGPRRLKEEKLLEHKMMVEGGKNIDPEDALRYKRKVELLKEQVIGTGSLGGVS